MLVTGGYDEPAPWLAGRDGHRGTLVEMNEDWALVELDEELVLAGRWPDFGSGSAVARGHVKRAHGRWLALAHGWLGQKWQEPIGRVHVALCADRPDLSAVPRGGGVGAWVESHAWMERLADAARSRSVAGGET